MTTSMTPAKRQNFERLLNPRHIAFIGGADAAVGITEARRAGYTGQMWVVNPRRTQIAGLPCLPDIAALPEPPDAVFLAIPAALVPAAVADLSAMGAGGIVCYSAGFAEAHDEGRALEQALKDALGDMVLIGPNCYGLINYVGKSALWPFAHGGTCPGYGAAIITQSGMFSSDITMSQRSLPVAYMASAGNQADLGMAEFIDLLCEREEVRAIGLHIEGLRNVPAFERAALKAIRAGTPIVALKTGSSAIGESLTLSHTGSLAGSNAHYTALFERTGVIPVTNPAQFLETLKYLCVAGAPEGTDVLGFTCSGGGATMLADHSETIGLRYPTPDAAAKAALVPLLPPIATVSNPLDYTTPIWGQQDKTGPVFDAAFAHIPVHAAVLVQDYPAPDLDESKQLYLNDGAAFADAARRAGLPAAICATIPENIGQEVRDHYVARGVAPMQGIHETLNAIRGASWWRRRQHEILSAAQKPLVPGRPIGPITLLNEAEGKARLATAGIAVPKGQLTNSAGLLSAATETGYPVVLKMMGPALAHKSDAGAVVVGIPDESALTLAAQEMRAAVARYAPEAVTDDYLVERMAAPPLAELVVGIRRDPQFGLAMTLGSGGILVELIGDTVSLLLPAQPADIHRALDQLRVAKLLNGFRGKPAADRAALVGALSQLAEYAIAQEAQIVEIEINPLFVYERDVVAVDVLMQVESA
ncbi:acetate--CoA ligase family protein [Roseovarius pelagicus]|uniref:Acetate--CoA ligase family protein n=1 Tax=Roseovarius pelagicus TaxID=2980108 RepID=A0ABY6DCY5_9RHOB|nr:acetate--CoA ligase family protein [Roseovarius pelagicus]UXX83058.1 acetate--CoA ligase family protein [Roseovarius pelagicus]